jgi:hypothetical protein
MKITVNGAQVEVDATAISYEMVQRIAKNGKVDRPHAVHFLNAANGMSGELRPGEAVEIAEGTVFNVYEAGAGT